MLLYFFFQVKRFFTEKDTLYYQVEKKVEVAMLLSDKVDFKKRLSRIKESLIIMIKGLLQQEYSSIRHANIYELNTRVSKYMKQRTAKRFRQIYDYTLRFLPISIIDRTSIKSVNIGNMKKSINQLALISI